MLRKALTASFALAMLLASAGPARAGGPFVVDMVGRTGVAQQWFDKEMVWCADEGALSNSVNNAEAITWMSEALNKWTSVTLQNASSAYVDTADISTQMGTSCSVGDIDATNYEEHVYSAEGPTVVIFDRTGDIVVDILGEQNRSQVVGLSQPIASDSSGLYITKGVAIFNGYMLDNDILSSDSTRAENLFKGTVLHELGHLLNLDHSQVNLDVAQACSLDNPDCENDNVIPTMYPELVTVMQGEVLTRDDKITISWIYPTDVFESDFCTITGEIFDANGSPLKGVNVIAKSALGGSAPMVDARAFVSGVLKPSCYGDSKYYLRGIKPGIPYKVVYEAIGSGFTGASDFEPLDNPPTGFPSGTIESTGGDTTVSCTEGGQTIQMASVTIDTPNPCAGFEDVEGTTTTATGESKGCSLAVTGGEVALPLLLALMLFSLTAPRLAGALKRSGS